VIETATRVVSDDGTRLAVSQAGEPARPTVVLIHGYPDTREMWRPVMSLLSRRFHTVAYDVRGAGASDVPRGFAAFDLAQLGDDLRAVIGAVAPGKQVHLVGHDWGGIQGWEFATLPRFDGQLASFTAIAAPSLDHVALAGPGLSGQPVRWILQARRSWYIAVLLAPGGPEVMWRGLLGRGRWRSALERVEHVPVDAAYPAPTLARDGIQGANLYRRNIPRRMRHPRPSAAARVPVQLITPTGDRYTPLSYYAAADRHAPALRRLIVPGSHWLPRTEPDRTAHWIDSFVSDVEAGILFSDAIAWRSPPA
jgi:pimeloyl-ACP methyl ester carboxylesterase